MSLHERPIGHKFCMIHLQEVLTFQCKDCRTLVCSQCVVSNHAGHTFDSITNQVQIQYNAMQDLRQEISDHMIPAIEEKDKSAEFTFEQVENMLQCRLQELNENAEKMRDVITIFVKNTMNAYETLRQEYKKDLSAYKNKIAYNINTLKLLSDESVSVTKSDSDIFMIDSACDVLSRKVTVENYQKPNIPDNLQKYTSKVPENVDLHLYQHIESVFSRTNARNKNSELSDRKMSTSEDSEHRHSGCKPQTEKILTPKPDINQKTSNKQSPSMMCKPIVGVAEPKSVMPMIEIKQVACLKHFPLSMVLSKAGTQYICSAENMLTSIDVSGRKHEVPLDIQLVLTDIALHPSTGKLFGVFYSCMDIRVLDPLTGRTRHIFDLEEMASCLAFTKNGDMIIGDADNPLIHIYSTRGYKKTTISCDKIYPLRIKVCRLTGKIAVCNLNLVVFNDGFKKLFKYSDSAINVVEVEFDLNGQLILGEDEEKLHVLNATTGFYLKKLTSDKMKGKVTCIATKNKKELFITTSDPRELLVCRY